MLFDSKEIEMLIEESKRLRQELLDTISDLDSYTLSLQKRIVELRAEVRRGGEDE